MKNREHSVVRAKDEVINVKVKNSADEELGRICELMLEKLSGKVAYAVLDCGSFLGMGGKLFALPWNVIHFDPQKECFILNVAKEKLKNAPGFDKDNWPDMADKNWGDSISQFYGIKD